LFCVSMSVISMGYQSLVNEYKKNPAGQL